MNVQSQTPTGHKGSWDSRCRARGILAIALCTLATGSPSLASPPLVSNLAASATGDGLLPNVALFQGTPAGIYNAHLFSWGGAADSPRATTTNNIQPYLTWSADQNVRIIRLWRDAAGTYDRVIIDTLSGADPAQEANWTSRYDTGAGTNVTFLDIDLGATYATRGLRIRTFRTANDCDVGEVAAFRPLPLGGTLSSHRVWPTNTTASSSRFRSPSEASDGNWMQYGWLADTTNNNPGSEWQLTQSFSNRTSFNAVSITFGMQPGYNCQPNSWQLQIDQGAGFVSLGTFTKVADRQQYYHNIDLQTDVRALRLVVQESETTDGALSVGVLEMEALLTVSAVRGTVILVR